MQSPQIQQAPRDSYCSHTCTVTVSVPMSKQTLKCIMTTNNNIFSNVSSPVWISACPQTHFWTSKLWATKLKFDPCSSLVVRVLLDTALPKSTYKTDDLLWSCCLASQTTVVFYSISSEAKQKRAGDIKITELSGPSSCIRLLFIHHKLPDNRTGTQLHITMSPQPAGAAELLCKKNSHSVSN